jgi:hypothetical protein
MTLTDTDQQLVPKLRTMYESARNAKRRLYERWTRSYRLVNNRYGGTSSNWMPQPRDSQVYPVCASLVSWMTDQRVSFEISASRSQKAPDYPIYASMAEDLERLLGTNWIVEDYGRSDRLVIWDSVLYGAGIYKVVWDPCLSDGYGNANLVRCDPWAFYPDPAATSLDDADYLIEVRRMSWDELERRYPDARMVTEAGGVLSGEEQMDRRPDLATEFDRQPKANPGALPGGNVRWSGPRSGRDYVMDDGVVVYEFWLRENRHREEEEEDEVYGIEVTDVWRLVVVANGQVLMDELASDLWEHGRHPYVRYAFDDLGDFWGVSLVEHLAHPQIYINRLLTALQHNAELIGNPIFLDPSNSGLDRVGIVNRPGQRLRTNSSAMQGSASGPQWLRPPDMPDGVRSLVDYWGSRMKQIAGLEALDQPKQRQGDKTTQSTQESAFVRVRDAIRARERSLTQAGILLSHLIVENYTVPRTVSIVGPQGERTALGLAGRHFWTPTAKGATPLKFMLTVQAGSSRPTSRSQRAAEAQTLRGLSALDTLTFLRMMEVPNADEIFQRLQQEAQAGMEQPGARQRARKK